MYYTLHVDRSMHAMNLVDKRRMPLQQRMQLKLFCYHKITERLVVSHAE